MKKLIYLSRILTTIFITISFFFFTFLNAQTIVVDSTFHTDGEIFPFEQNDTIYGLSISGSVTLNSDTRLVKIPIGDLQYSSFERE